jgi:hypothetical protein
LFVFCFWDTLPKLVSNLWSSSTSWVGGITDVYLHAWPQISFYVKKWFLCKYDYDVISNIISAFSALEGFASSLPSTFIPYCLLHVSHTLSHSMWLKLNIYWLVPVKNQSLEDRRRIMPTKVWVRLWGKRRVSRYPSRRAFHQKMGMPGGAGSSGWVN